MYGVVYQAKCTVNNKIYIGITINLNKRKNRNWSRESRPYNRFPENIEKQRSAIRPSMKRFKAYMNGEYLGEFISQAGFAREHNIRASHISMFFSGKLKKVAGRYTFERFKA